jgi:phage tail sheath protein FI
MPFQVSPGVSVVETDLTTIVPTISTTAAGFVGAFAWGPANEVKTISSENELREIYGDPDEDNFTYWFSAANFLRYGSNLQVVRAVTGDAKNAGTSGGIVGYPLSEKLDAITGDIYAADKGVFASRYPGVIGNNIGIAVLDSAEAGVTLATWGTNGVFGSYFREIPNTSARASERTGITEGFNDELHVIVYDASGYFTGSKNTPLEIYEGLSKATDAKKDDGTSNFYRTAINNQSRYIVALRGTSSASNTGAAPVTTIQSTYGGSSGASFGDFFSGLSAGLQLTGGTATGNTGAINFYYTEAFANAETQDVSLLIAGPADNTTRNTIVDIAETRKDCVAFVSPDLADVTSGTETTKTDAIIAARNEITTKSSYAVMDSGWKYQYDPYNDKFRFVPLNADIAGLCAKTDQIAEPWFSPAGFNRGAIRNVIKLAYSPNKTSRDKLYVKGINPVVSFTGEGIVLFGDKTMQAKPSAFDRINVRRLFNIIEKAISTAAKFSLFEFNDEFTRAAFRNLIEPFLRDVQARRGIFDFKVVCDETNNTPLVIDKNEFKADIYVKPARSINFITLNFVASPTGVDFDEIGA